LEKDGKAEDRGRQSRRRRKGEQAILMGVFIVEDVVPEGHGDGLLAATTREKCG